MTPSSAFNDCPDEDQDSLFGSPPPSPRGRSPFPALALPSPSSSGNSSSSTLSSATALQNVGTIALPGSHPYSELPVNPLALSSSLQKTPRPPAQGINTNLPQSVNPPHNHFSIPVYPQSTFCSSSAPSQKQRKKFQGKSKESTPRPPGPEIPLPLPDAPVPANFLRNQTALLGTAGLVGGVRPAKLSTSRHVRGTTSANPIVVEDEQDTPMLGKSSFRHPYIGSIDPNVLPAPSNQDIVAMLIGQKDIFPVLENILKLIASQGHSNPPPQPTTSQRFAPVPVNQTNQLDRQAIRPGFLAPAKKKRKLNRVPAGASDWDVPYPFEHGEGPDSYRSNWERERGKQLISQLVNLIKTAARKAATKNYLRNEEIKKKVLEEEFRQKLELERQKELEKQLANGDLQMGETAMENCQQPRVNKLQPLQSSGINPHGIQANQNASSNVVAGNSLIFQHPQPTPFDRLISSLLAVSPEQGLLSNYATDSLDENTINQVGFSTADNGNADWAMSPDFNGGVDQALFDNWMNVLQTFPMPAEGFSQANAQPLVAAGHPFSSPGPMSPELDLTFYNDNAKFVFNGGMTTDSSMAELEALLVPMSAGVETTTFTNLKSDENPEPSPATEYLPPFPDLSDHSIDPELLAISIPQPMQPNQSVSGGARESQPPSLVPSPIPSMSSYTGAEPGTPNSASWESSNPEVFVSGGDLGTQGMLRHAIWNRSRNTQWTKRKGEQGLSALLETERGMVKGKMKELVPAPDKPVQFSSPLSTLNWISSTERPEVRDPAMRIDREDILKRGRERKQQLTAELERVKVQLWETTIEQAALVHLIKNIEREGANT